MEEQRRIRMAAAITVNVILLMVILTAVIIYQLIAIGVGNGRKKAMEKEISEYTQKLEEKQNDLDYLKSEEFLLDKAFELGYSFPKD